MNVGKTLFAQVMDFVPWMAGDNYLGRAVRIVVAEHLEELRPHSRSSD